jgi:YHS domain-containing protein
MIFHCSLNDPSYCSDLDYYNEGLDSSAVRGLVAGNNALWVFKEPSQANTTVFYHNPTTDAEYGKIYPSVHSSISAGCVGKAINFNDDIVFFGARGMEGISGDITTEQVVGHRSTMVDRKLTAEPNYADMLLEEWEGYLLVFVDDRVYLADSRATFENTGHFEYEWFYWNIGKTVKCAKVNNGILYVGTADGVYSLTDTTSAVEAWWTTPLDKFKYPQHLKTTNKRGCVSEATGDISVYVKTEKTEFEQIGEYKGVTDYFVSRIKRKKFKDLQIKFHSDTRFSLESATLEW